MERYDWPFGLLYVDIDHFKKVNDEFGHDIGDEVLKMVARTLAHATRSFDTVGRWGGEEFLAVLAAVDMEKLRIIGDGSNSWSTPNCPLVKEESR
jgi:diguanylate cyclase (GGDEF)-like protein